MKEDYQFVHVDHGMGVKSSIYPLFTFDINIPEQSKLINFYNGQARGLRKENYLQPSSAMRHAYELCKIVGRVS